MRTILFQPRFAELVAAGAKCQTVRAARRRPPVAGEAFSLRRWSGAPYRSPQIELLKVTIKAVSEVVIHPTYVAVANELCLVEPFAKDDGFSSFHELLDWFKKVHGLPFVGILIEW